MRSAAGRIAPRDLRRQRVNARLELRGDLLDRRRPASVCVVVWVPAGCVKSWKMLGMLAAPIVATNATIRKMMKAFIHTEVFALLIATTFSSAGVATKRARVSLCGRTPGPLVYVGSLGRRCPGRRAAH